MCNEDPNLESSHKPGGGIGSKTRGYGEEGMPLLIQPTSGDWAFVTAAEVVFIL